MNVLKRSELGQSCGNSEFVELGTESGADGAGSAWDNASVSPAVGNA